MQKNHGDGQFQKFAVFNFAILLKSQNAREIYTFYSIIQLTTEGARPGYPGAISLC